MDSERPDSGVGPGQDREASQSLERRRRYLEQLQRILPHDEPWERWLRETGELPPDFEELLSCPDLPEPLARKVDGEIVPIKTTEEWRERREELKRLFHHWILGTVPPPPDNLQAEVEEERRENAAIVREVKLTFDGARLRVELLIPEGCGPFPVFMTQFGHRPWAYIALRRGYLACLYAAGDDDDDTDTFLEAYPDYDWSRLTRRAWAAGRCVDYLKGVPEADAKQIAIAGHSRNGKQSLIASALDERIAVVISSSSGAGGAMTTRYYSDLHFAESAELLVRRFPDWYHPRLRFFAGREHKLPVDFHELVAMSAPRPCLLSIALNDSVESTWAMQETYLAAKQVYHLLDAGENLRILWRPGGHETSAAIIERYLDWCDSHFGRREHPFPERLIHPCDWEAWREKSGEKVKLADFPRRGLDDLLTLNDEARVTSAKVWEKKREEIRAQVRWMLGEPPSVVSNPGRPGKEISRIESLLNRSEAGEGLKRERIVFGEFINGDVYYPAGLRESGQKAPAILWLHPFSFSHGYAAGYCRGDSYERSYRDGEVQRGTYQSGEQMFRTLAREGFVVFCFDQIGLGLRIEEVEDFYRRHPRWSLLGKMVRDSQAALDALAMLSYVDTEKVLAVGYSLGSLVGLHLGALDERLAGLVSVCGPPPFRSDTPEKATGGIRRWSHLYMLCPRMGFFVSEEERLPYDVHGLMACIAPRPLAVISPKLDREANIADVTEAVEAARAAYDFYDVTDSIIQLSPEDYNHFGMKMQALVIEAISRWIQR